jgi:hypothetical protein
MRFVSTVFILHNTFTHTPLPPPLKYHPATASPTTYTPLLLIRRTVYLCRSLSATLQMGVNYIQLQLFTLTLTIPYIFIPLSPAPIDSADFNASSNQYFVWNRTEMSFRSTLPAGNISRCLAINTTLINPNINLPPWEPPSGGSLVIQRCNSNDPTQKFIFNLSRLSISSLSNPSLCLSMMFIWGRTDGIYWYDCTFSQSISQIWVLSQSNEPFCNINFFVGSKQLRLCNARSPTLVSSTSL